MVSSLAHILIGSFIFLELTSRSCLYIFEINSLSVASFAVIFSHSEGCLFTLLIVSFVVQRLLILIRPHLFFLFCFYFHYSGRWVIEDLAVIYVEECSIYNNFMKSFLRGKAFVFFVSILYVFDQHQMLNASNSTSCIGGI